MDGQQEGGQPKSASAPPSATDSGDDHGDDSRRLVMTRTFAAPRDLVFEVFTDPDHIGEWWGPHGFSTTTDRYELTPGGHWVFTMHGPDGTDYSNHIVFREVVRSRRLVYNHSDGDGPNPNACHFHTTISFDDADGGTRVTLDMLFPSEAECANARNFGAVAGGHQTLERFDALVTFAEHRARGFELFKLTRTFDAPLARVWNAFSTREAMAAWWGPAGWQISVSDFVFEAGGAFHYRMHRASGDEMWGRMVYREITAPKRIVFINAFSDAEGGLRRAPFLAAFPLEILYDLRFATDGQQTRLTLTGAPLAATADERAAYQAMHKSMQHGFAATFDQLAAYLAGARA